MGLLVGVVAVVAFRISEREQRTVPPQPEPVIDEGLVRTLAVLRSAAVVLDEAGDVVRATPLAYALGVLHAGGRLNPVIQPIVDEVRRDGVIQDTELELSRGQLGRSEISLEVRVAQVTPRHLLILADDRTEAKRLEAIRRDFVVNVSHELKTPVGALQLLAETIGDAAEDPEAVRAEQLMRDELRTRYGVDVDAIRAAADEPGSSDPGERLLNAWFATDPA